MKHSQRKEHRKKEFSKRIFMLLFSAFLSLGFIHAQINISGTVTDENSEPLIGASVIIKNTTKGTLTDVNGKYTITVPDTKATLVVSLIGFTSKEVSVGNQKVVNVVLGEDVKLLDEVVVVGYGVQKKSDLTGGVSSIQSDKIEKIPAMSLGQKLQGQVAGLRVAIGNARPGEDVTLRIRGEKSLSGSNNPLIILDGIPFNGNFTEIDQNSVDNISILRDASSAAIYGSRAANGVILITTKKGKIGKPLIRYNGYVGIQEAEYLPKTMNGDEYIQLLKDFQRDMGNKNWDDPKNYMNIGLYENYKNGMPATDWQKEVYKSALQQEHQLSLSGATESTNYYTSISFADQEGIVRYTGYKKYSLTSNITQKLGKIVTIGANIQLVQRDRGGVEPQYSYGLRMSPYARVKDDSGKYIRYPMDNETLYYSPFANYDGVNDDKSRGAYLSGFAEIKLPFVKGLSYRANFGYSYRHRDRGSYYGKTTLTGSKVGGQAEIIDNSYTDWTWENVVRYDRDFGKHHLDLTGLFSAQETADSEHKSKGEGFVSDANEYHNIQAAQGKKTIESDYKETALLSWMGRINYSFAKKYLLTLTGRRDGYSAFGDNNKWAFFPSAAVAWLVTEESFFKNWNISDIDYLKFRASYGSNGNRAVDPYATKTKLAVRNYIWGNEATLAPGVVSLYEMGNPNLKWETTSSLNIGLDLNLFNNRVIGTFDYYHSKTKDLIMNRSVPVMNGYTLVKDNVGKTENKGFDISLNTVNIKNKDFQWNTTFVLSGNWDKILELQVDKDGKPKDDIANKWFIGQPLRVYYDVKVTGIWQENEVEEMKKWKYWGKTPQAGDAKLENISGDDYLINNDDRQVIGSRTPVWTAGLTNTVSYKNWSLSVFVNGVFDQTRQNESVKFERLLLSKNLNFVKDIEYWTPENPSNKNTRLAYNNTNHQFYLKYDYIKIQDINLSYSFPKSLTSKLGIQELGTYINVHNLYTFSKAKKYTANIERTDNNSTFAIDSNGYPAQRVFVFGLNLTF